MNWEKAVGLKMGTRGGEFAWIIMRTSNPSIFAIGEIALYNQIGGGKLFFFKLGGFFFLLGLTPGYEMAARCRRSNK